jgi:hypothetical protein
MKLFKKNTVTEDVADIAQTKKPTNKLFKVKGGEAAKVKPRKILLDDAIPDETIDEDDALEASGTPVAPVAPSKPTLTLGNKTLGSKTGSRMDVMKLDADMAKAKAEAMASQVAMKSAEGVLKKITPPIITTLKFYRLIKPAYDVLFAPWINVVVAYILEWDINELLTPWMGIILVFYGGEITARLKFAFRSHHRSFLCRMLSALRVGIRSIHASRLRRLRQ